MNLQCHTLKNILVPLGTLPCSLTPPPFYIKNEFLTIAQETKVIENNLVDLSQTVQKREIESAKIYNIENDWRFLNSSRVN